MEPFTTFRGTLKQLSLEGIEEPARINAFQWAFPAFLDPLIGAQDAPSGAKARRRRYSGGLIDGLKPLPRGRYSTVCIRADGYDNGGLCRELSAYAGSIVQQRVRVLDNLDPSVNTSQTIEVWFDDYDGQIIARLASDGVGSAFSLSAANPGTFGMSLYYTTCDVEIDHTIDLRLPATQDWFVHKFRSVFGRTRGEAGGASAPRFLDVLPELISRDLGGSQITDVIGHCLRRLGAAALIYPSARCDARVVVKDGVLTGWYGFNLVDFRDAAQLLQDPDLTPEALFEDHEPCRTHFDWPGARCIAVDPADDDPLRLNGSWHMTRVEQSHYEFFRAGGALGGREGGDWKNVEVDERGNLLQQVLLQLRGTKPADGIKLFESEEFRVDVDRPDGELLHHAIQLHAISTSLSSRGHAEKALTVWTQSAEALRKVVEAKDAGVALAARLKLGSMLHHVIVERMGAGDVAGALAVGDEALRMLKPASTSEPEQTSTASAPSSISAQLSVMMRTEYGRCLNNLGTARAGAGQAETARQLFEEAVAVDRTLIEADGAPLELARALQNYSAASLSMGEPRMALEAAHEAAELCREADSNDAVGLRARRGALHALQAALVALSEFDQAMDVSTELMALAFHVMHVKPELVDEFALDPLRISATYVTAGRHGMAQAIVDKAIEGYQAVLSSDPLRFTDLLAKEYFLRASVAAADSRHEEVAASAFSAASTMYTYKDLLFGGARDKFVESDYHEAFTQFVDLFHSAMIQSGRQAEVIAKLAELDMRPAPTDGPAADAFLLMQTAANACNAFFEARSETTQTAAEEAIARVESFFLAHPERVDLEDLKREWDRMMAQLRRT